MRVAIDQRLILEAIRRISDAKLIQLVDEAARKGGLKATPKDDDTFLNDEKGCLFLLNAQNSEAETTHWHPKRGTGKCRLLCSRNSHY